MNRQTITHTVFRIFSLQQFESWSISIILDCWINQQNFMQMTRVFSIGQQTTCACLNDRIECICLLLTSITYSNVTPLHHNKVKIKKLLEKVL